MEWWQAVILAIVQGLTEFLPVSSSAHLILPSHIFGWPDQGLAFDVAVHVGTLMAVIWYFRDDIRQLSKGFIKTTFLGKPNKDGRLAWYIGLATIPAGLLGLLLNGSVEQYLRDTAVIATSTIVFGLLLLFADSRSNLQKKLTDMPLSQAMFIGIAQAIALIPGTSRSGITMTAAMLMGYERSAAARFSFLLSIPLILLAGGYKGFELYVNGSTVYWGLMAIGIVVSCISAYICIYFFLKIIEKLSMLPFVIYRLLLGGFLFLALGFNWIS
ncbi:MAG: undecaprenyl-diphosphatase [Bermanella sp.]|jgi:undecaprenyl-diphosphatase